MLLEEAIRDIEEYEKQVHVLMEQTRDLQKQSDRLTLERQIKVRLNRHDYYRPLKLMFAINSLGICCAIEQK
jgi:hypothetical protein